MNELEKRIAELSFKHKLTHVSSCLNCVNLIAWIYEQRKPDDPFVLDNSHASLALYVVLEMHGYCNAEDMIGKHGTHASRDMEHGIYVSGGSLGQAATVAAGMALADLNRNVWLVTSDGATMEGCVTEALRFAHHRLPNLRTWIVFNGYGAYGKISHGDLPIDANVQYVDERHYPVWLRGLAGHYLTLNQEQYEELMA